MHQQDGVFLVRVAARILKGIAELLAGQLTLLAGIDCLRGARCAIFRIDFLKHKRLSSWGNDETHTFWEPVRSSSGIAWMLQKVQHSLSS